MSLWFNISNSEVAVIFFITCLRVIDSTTRIINRNLVNFCATVIKKQICISLGTLQHNSYSHLIEYSTVNAGIIDDDRRLNAERMEAAFYSGRQATPKPVQPAATESSADDKELLLKLLQNPEMAALLKSLAKTL